MNALKSAARRIATWIEYWRDLKRYNRGQLDYEAAVGRNLRDVEDHIKSSARKRGLEK